MKDSDYHILVINPGSTSTKLAIYKNDVGVAQATIRHNADELKALSNITEQKYYRLLCAEEFLENQNIAPETLSAVVGRGGLVKPIASGTYTVNEKMLEDLYDKSASAHASGLGSIIAAELGKRYNIPAYTVDPVVVDERAPVAKISGMPLIERKSRFHALNSKAVARICAEKLQKKYTESRFIVAHMGGGVSVGAHLNGMIVDVNDCLYGEGPLSPERSGSVPLVPLVELCYSGEYSKEDIEAMIYKHGGMYAYIGTNNLTQAEEMIKNGDEKARLVVEAMAYQISKEIGAMTAVLEGLVDAIILTGGLAYSSYFVGLITQRVGRFAQVIVFPGEDEMKALAEGALRVLNGSEMALTY